MTLLVFFEDPMIQAKSQPPFFMNVITSNQQTFKFLVIIMSKLKKQVSTNETKLIDNHVGDQEILDLVIAHNQPGT